MNARSSRRVMVRGLAVGCWILTATIGIGSESKIAETSWYEWKVNKQPAGYLMISRGPSGDEDAPVLLIGRYELVFRGSRMSLGLSLWCRDDALLRPVRLAASGEGEEALTFEAKVDWDLPFGCSEGDLQAEVGGRKVTLVFGEHTTTSLALFELVRRLPFRKGVVMKCDVLEAEELNLKKEHQVSHLGKDGSLHKFEQSGRGISPAYYWVNDRRELVRVVIDGRKELTLSTKEKAEACLKNAMKSSGGEE